MAEQTEFQVLDSCPIEYADFHNIMERWLTDLVDIFNASMTLLNNSILIGSSDNVSATPLATATIPVIGITPVSLVTAIVSESTNNVTVIAVTSGTDQFTVTLSGDPGANLIINYTAIIATK